MPVRVDLSSNASVRSICVDEDNTACAYLANLYIPVFALDSGRVIHTFDVHNQIVGLQLRPEKKHTLYAIDDSFGMHIFDVRSNSRNKKRLNPEVENHNVVCTALSSSNILAISSSEFGGGILDVRGSRRREHHPHAVTLFDIRYAGEPVTTYAKKHGSEVTCMEFYKNGHDLLTGDMNGGMKVFNTQLRDEDNACRWERWMRGPITKVGVINKRIVYGVGYRSEATVFVDNNKGPLETLYGSVQESANKPITKTSKAFYKKPEWCIGLMKGVNDDLPLVAVHGVHNEKFISLTAMDQLGVRQEKPLLTYAGHTGEVKCMTATSKLLLTGGEDGKVVIQYSDFKNPQFGHDSIPDHRLTLNRGNLAEKHDAGEDDDEPEPEPETEQIEKKESSDSDSDVSDSDDEVSSKKKKPTTSAASAPSTSSAAASSSSSKPGERKRTDSEERLFQKYMREENSLAKKRERKDRLRKEMKKRDRKRRESNGWETVDEDDERIEIEKREKEEKEKKKARIAAGLEVETKEKPKKKKKLSGSFPKRSGSDSPKRDEPSTSAQSSSSSSKKESKEERAARKEREAKEARRKARKEKEAEEERKAKEDREKRKAMKLAETKEERAARKDRERKEREREEREREQRKKEERKKQKSQEEEPKSKKSKLK